MKKLSGEIHSASDGTDACCVVYVAPPVAWCGRVVAPSVAWCARVVASLVAWCGGATCRMVWCGGATCRLVWCGGARCADRTLCLWKLGPVDRRHWDAACEGRGAASKQHPALRSLEHGGRWTASARRLTLTLARSCRPEARPGPADPRQGLVDLVAHCQRQGRTTLAKC